MSDFGKPPGGGGFGQRPEGGPPGGGGFGPPQGGGLPPAGGFGPPQGGGLPPAGGFGPPQGGGLPPAGGFGPPQGGPGGGAPQTDPLAIASLAVGAFGLITGLCCGLCGAPFPAAALIMGILSISRIRNEPGRYTGNNLAIAGTAAGAVGLLLVFVALVVGVSFNLMEQLQQQH